MEGRSRYYYPGGNTSKGFFSYYDYILSQDKASKIYCMKGGPGTGKSTFMRNIGEKMLAEGLDVDFLLCSSDPDSLDGILIRSSNIALIDGTAPHIVDPLNPGAVDCIINLGEFWDEKGIRRKKDEVLIIGDYIKACYSKAYKCLKAASEIRDAMEEMYESDTKREEMYKNSAGIINRELSHIELSNTLGIEKRFFAGAITPKGVRSTVKSLICNCRKTYILKAPVGMNTNIFLDGFKDSARKRGLETEAYYCPLSPDRRIEHLIIPEISTAIVSSNSFHEIPIASAEVIDMRIYLKNELLDRHKKDLAKGEEILKELINLCISHLKDAKESHDILEEIYISNMDFEAIEKKRVQVMEEIMNLC